MKSFGLWLLLMAVAASTLVFLALTGNCSSTVAKTERSWKRSKRGLHVHLLLGGGARVLRMKSTLYDSGQDGEWMILLLGILKFGSPFLRSVFLLSKYGFFIFSFFVVPFPFPGWCYILSRCIDSHRDRSEVVRVGTGGLLVFPTHSSGHSLPTPGIHSSSRASPSPMTHFLLSRMMRLCLSMAFQCLESEDLASHVSKEVSQIIFSENFGPVGVALGEKAPYGM